MCWWPSPDEEVDEYYIRLHPQINQAQTREFWVNSSTCVSLAQLKPGGTYVVEVAAVKDKNRSAPISIRKTLSMICLFLSSFSFISLMMPLSQSIICIFMLVSEPDSIQIAVPYAVGTHSVELFVQMPRNSIYDGITITYQNNRSWTPVSKDSTKVVVGNLNPGTQYNFYVFVTSRDTSSDGFTLPPVSTCEKTFEILTFYNSYCSHKYFTGQNCGIIPIF